MKEYKQQFPGLYYFETFTFTTLGTSGSRGPDVSKTYANAPWLDGDFYIQDGQQYWTVPTNGTYQITAAGAYGATPGRVVSGEVKLNEGQALRLLVGQCPSQLTANVQDNVTVGGGGGTFVVSGDTPLIVASGGDGEAYSDNPWSQPVIVSFSGGAFLGVVLFANDTGTNFTLAEFDNTFQIIGTRLYEYDGVNWNSTFLFPGACSYVNKTLGIAYSFTWLDAYTVSASDWSYMNGTWSKTTYNDLTLPFQGTLGFTDIQVSGNGETLRIVYASGMSGAMYKRINNQWTFVTTLPRNDNGLSYDGNRLIVPFIEPGYSQVNIYDYPWISSPTIYIIPEPDFYNNNCRISPDGTLLLTFSNIYSLSDGSTVTTLPGYLYGSQADLNISKDNKTIIKGFYGSELQVLEYPFTQVRAVLSPVSAVSFYGSPFINQDGSVIIGSDPFIGADVYYKNFKPQHGLFLPSGTGTGDSGAGFFGNGAQTNPYFQFLVPEAYVNGGFGNSYWYGQKGEGGFGGGQSPLNKLNTLTKFTISSSPSTFSLGGNPTVVSVNSDATVLYYGTTRYLYSGGSWNYDQDFSYSQGDGFLSVSDNGMTAVSSYQLNPFVTTTNRPLGIVAGTQLYTMTGTYARVNKQGTRIVYSVYPGPNVFIRDAPFTGGDYQLTLPSSFPNTSNIASLDFSSDGTVLAIGFYVGNTGYGVDGALRILITRYPWTTYETIINAGNIVSLSPNGKTLFAATSSGDASYMYKYNYNNQNEWQLVSQSQSGYKNTSYLASGSDGSLFVKPGIVANEPSLVFNFTAYDDFSQVGSVSNSHVSNMSSDGQHLVHYNGSLHFYNKQLITANTHVDHGFPHEYQVKYELTANYNGIHEITVTTANTFTFKGFSFANESGNLGAVSGIELGISGGGGYTGSPGDGVSGATCYADASVENFTDLGASGNTAGYVTVSLIDPVPLKQTWTWDKTFQSQSSNGPFKTLQWSSELNTFLSMSGSSTDGMTWSGSPYITPQTQTLMFVAYSSTLNIYVGILRKPNQLTTFLANSVDGIIWNSLFDISSAQTATTGVVWSTELSRFVVIELLKIWYSDNGIDWTVAYTGGGSLIGITYADSINTFVVTRSPLPLYSTDGINWTEATSDSGSNAWKGAAWSPVLNLFIIVSPTPGGPYILYSSDGQTWTNYGIDAPIDIRWSVVIWSDFGIFSVIGPSGKSMYSSDGIHWTLTGVPVQSPDSITYSPSLKFFVCVAGNSFFISIEGKYWAIRNFFGTNSGAWSPELGLFVTLNGFTSNDGITWTPPFQTTSFKQITWITQLGLFIGVSSSRYYYSYDGITWNQSIYDGVVSRIAWSSEKGIIAGAAYSRDGITWFDSFNGSGNVNFLPVWSKELGIFTALSGNQTIVPTNYSYYSYDGINWIQGSGPSIFFPSSTITWSPLLGMFICSGANGFQTCYVYSMNGLDWIVVNFNNLTITWINELSLFVSGWFDGTYTSVDGLNWTKLSTQLICSNMWSPELGRLVAAGGYSDATKTF